MKAFYIALASLLLIIPEVYPKKGFTVNQVVVKSGKGARKYPPCAYDERYEQWGDIRIRLDTRDVLFDEAERICKYDGAKLVSIHSQADTDAIMDYYAHHGSTGYPWIGLIREAPHNFLWADDTKLVVDKDGNAPDGAYTNWKSYDGIKNRFARQRCLFIWYDLPNFPWDLWLCDDPEHAMPSLCQCHYEYMEQGKGGNGGGDM